MKIALHSDLHDDVYHGADRFFQAYPELPAADVVILAGDNHRSDQIIEFAEQLRQKQHAKAAIVIAGNHEFYQTDYDRALQLMRDTAADLQQVHFLEQDSIVIDGVRFLGTTLWTDFELFGADTKARAMTEASAVMMDYRAIEYKGRMLTAEDTVDLFNQAYPWLCQTVAEPHNGKTVAITHHVPSFQCLPPRYADLMSSAAFGSNLDKLIEKELADIWVYGHTHYSQQLQVGKTQLCSNARGYFSESNRTGYQHDFIIDLTE